MSPSLGSQSYLLMSNIPAYRPIGAGTNQLAVIRLQETECKEEKQLSL